MKKLFQIVFYYDKFQANKACESKILIESELVAKEIANKICNEKKMFFKLKEFYC